MRGWLFFIILFVLTSAYSFTYRIPIDVRSSAETVNQYQLLLVVDTASLISAGHMSADCSDIRFTSSQSWDFSDWGETFPYYIESGCNTSETKIWVKLPTLSNTTTERIYMYYGDSLPSASDPSSVFDFYDDAELYDGWVNYSSGYVTLDCSVSFDGNCSFHKQGNNDPNGAYKPLTYSLSRNIILDVWIKRNGSYSGGAWDRVGLIDDSGNGYGLGVAPAYSSNNYRIDVRQNYNGYYTTVSGTAVGTDVWYKSSLSINQTCVSLEVYSSNGQLLNSLYILNDSFSNFTRVYIFGGHDYWVDNIRIRKYVSSDPIVSYGIEEQRIGPYVTPSSGTNSIDFIFSYTGGGNHSVLFYNDFSHDGLILWLPLEEGYGNKTKDYSGHVDYCSIDGATWEFDNGRTYLNFSGSDSYVKCGPTDTFKVETFTLEMWVYPDDDYQKDLMFNGKHYQHKIGFNIYTNPPWTYGNLLIGNGTSHQLKSNFVNYKSPKEWNFIAITFDENKTARFYLNGEYQYSYNFDYFPNYTSYDGLYFGVSNARYLNGSLDDIKLYNRALSAAEIRKHYLSHVFNASNKVNLNPSDVALWIPFSEGYGSTAMDYSGNNITATLKNGAYFSQGVYGSGVRVVDNSYVVIPYNDSWWSPDEFTTSLWVKSEVNQSPSNAFIIKPVGSISNRWELSYHDAERLAFYMYNGSAASSLVAYKVLLADGKWHHIALKFKANETQEIWVDGTRVASKKPSFDTGLGSTDRELRLGGRGWWLQNNIYFQGYFDDFRLYKRALSDDEIIYLSTMYPKQVNSTLPISRYNDFYFSTMYDRKMLKWKIKDTSHNARWNTYSHVLVPVFGDNLSEQYSFKLNTTYGDVKFITDPDWNVIFFDYNNFSATDVHVYDTNGNTNYTCTNLSYCGWSLVNYTWHNFTGDIVVDNGIIRLVLRPGVQSNQNKLLYWNGTSWYQFYQYFPYYASGTPGVYNITKLSSDEVEVVFFVNDTDGSEANRYQHTNDSFIIKRGYPAIFKKVVPYPDSENLYYDEFFRITSSSQSCVKFGYKYNHINLYPTNDVSIWGDHSQTYLAFCNESGALFIVSHRNDTSGVLYHSQYIMTAACQPNNTDWYWVDFVLPFNVTNLLHQAEDFTHPSSVYIIDEPNASFDKALYYNQSAGWSYKTVRLEKGQYLIFYRLSVNDTTASQPLTIIANSSNVNYNKTVLPSDASNFPTYNYIYLNVSLDSNDNLSIGVLGEGIDASWYVDAVVIIPVSDGSSFPLDISQALLYVLDLNYSDAPTPTDPWFSPPNKILETFSDGDVHDYSPFYWNENGNWYLSDVYKGNGLSIVNTSINNFHIHADVKLGGNAGIIFNYYNGTYFTCFLNTSGIFLGFYNGSMNIINSYSKSLYSNTWYSLDVYNVEDKTSCYLGDVMYLSNTTARAGYFGLYSTGNSSFDNVSLSSVVWQYRIPVLVDTDEHVDIIVHASVNLTDVNEESFRVVHGTKPIPFNYVKSGNEYTFFWRANVSSPTYYYIYYDNRPVFKSYGLEGVVLWYDFDDLWYSSTLTDYSGYSNDGLLNNVDLVDGVSGVAVYLDGSSGSYINLSTPIHFSDNESYTIEHWIKPEPLGWTGVNLFSGTIGPFHDWKHMIMIMDSGSGSTCRLSFYDNNHFVAGYLDWGKWYHTALVSDNGTFKWYINGVLTASSTSFNESTTLYTVGSTYTGNLNVRFNGSIDNIVVYNRALSDYEIRSHYLSGLPEHPDKPIDYMINTQSGSGHHTTYSARPVEQYSGVFPLYGPYMAMVNVTTDSSQEDHYTNQNILHHNVSMIITNETYLWYWVRSAQDSYLRASAQVYNTSDSFYTWFNPVADQNGLKGDWHTHMNDYYFNKWFFRKVPLLYYTGHKAGNITLFTNDDPTITTGSADHIFFFDNVQLVNTTVSVVPSTTQIYFYSTGPVVDLVNISGSNSVSDSWHVVGNASFYTGTNTSMVVNCTIGTYYNYSDIYPGYYDIVMNPLVCTTHEITCFGYDSLYTNIVSNVTIPFDPDNHQIICEACGFGWNKNKWNEVPTYCCGDDEGENLLHRQCDPSVCLTDEYDKACCSSSDMCVYNGLCYGDGEVLTSKQLKCVSGVWKGTPSRYVSFYTPEVSLVNDTDFARAVIFGINYDYVFNITVSNATTGEVLFTASSTFDDVGQSLIPFVISNEGLVNVTWYVYNSTATITDTVQKNVTKLYVDLSAESSRILNKVGYHTSQPKFITLNVSNPSSVERNFQISVQSSNCLARFYDTKEYSRDVVINPYGYDVFYLDLIPVMDGNCVVDVTVSSGIFSQTEELIIQIATSYGRTVKYTLTPDVCMAYVIILLLVSIVVVYLI